MPFGALANGCPVRLGGSAEEGWSPAQHARFCADLLAVKRTAPLATWRMHTLFNGVAPQIFDYFGQNGSGLAHKPNVVRTGAGNVRCQWDSYVFEDEYGIVEPFKIRMVDVQASGSTEVSATWEVVQDGVRIRRFFAFNDAQDGILSVKVW